MTRCSLPANFACLVLSISLCTVASAQDTGTAACSANTDPVNLSQNFDILNGQRSLLSNSDLVVTAPRLTVPNINSSHIVTGWQYWQPTSIAVPFGNNALPTVSWGSSKAVPIGRNVGPDTGDAPMLRTVAGRFFDTAFDHMIQIQPVNAQNPQNGWIRPLFEVLRYDNTTSPGTIQSVATQTLTIYGPANFVAGQKAKMDVIVADFNQDGYDDLTFTLGGTANARSHYVYYFWTAVDTSDPTQGLKLASSQTTTHPYSGAVHGLGDLNGDKILDVAKPVNCFLNNTACELRFFSICPGAVPNTLCDEAEAFEIIEHSNTISLSAIVERCTAWAAPAQTRVPDPTCALAVNVGDFDPTTTSDELFLATFDNVKLEIIPSFYTVDASFKATELGGAQPIGVGSHGTTGFLAANGPIDFFGEGEQLVLSWVSEYSNSINKGSNLWVYVYWYDPTQEQIDFADGVLESNEAGALLGLSLGNFLTIRDDNEDPSNYNLRIGTLRSEAQKASLKVWEVYTGSECNNQKPFCGLGNTIYGYSLGESFGNVADTQIGTLSRYSTQSGSLLTTGDLQGRGRRLGQPIIARIQKIIPSAITASPPMHLDRLRIQGFSEDLFPTDVNLNSKSLCDQTAASDITSSTTCTIDFSALNIGNAYATTYVAEGTSEVTASTTHRSSWSLASTAQLSREWKAGAVFAYGQGNVTISGGYTHEKETADVSSSYCSQSFTLSESSKVSDVLNFKFLTQNIYYYPVIGQTCSASGETCQSDSTTPEPLYYPVAAPGQIYFFNGASGNTLEWYQPPWVTGQLLSYPSDLTQLEAGFLGPALNQELSNKFTTGFTDVTNQDGVLTSVEWKSGSSENSMADTANNWNVGASFSYSTQAGFEKFKGGVSSKTSLKLSVNYSGSSATLTTNSSSFSGSTGVSVNMDADILSDGSRFIYSIEPNIFGQQLAPIDGQQAMVFDPPFAGLTGDPQINGVTMTGMLVNFPVSTSWWLDSTVQGYQRYIDVALAHPLRYIIQNGGGVQSPRRTQCRSAGTASCGQFSRIIEGDVWGSDAYALRGFFFAPADPDNASQGATGPNHAVPTGPSTNKITDGDSVWLQARVYNFSFQDMANAGVDHVVVQFYAQQWDTDCNQPWGTKGPNCNQSATGDVVPSKLIAAVDDVAPLKGFPVLPNTSAVATATSLGGMAAPGPNWIYVNPASAWDTTGFGGTEGVDYVFWVNVCAADSTGNSVVELPGHGLTGTVSCAKQYDWIADVPIETYSNNVGLYKMVFHILPPETTVEGAPLDPPGALRIERMAVNGIPRTILGVDGQPPEIERFEVEVMLRGDDNSGNGAIVNFYHGDPLASGALFDQEIVPHIRAGERHQVRVGFRPSECGSHTITAQVLDRQNNPTKATIVKVPCN